MKNYVIATGRWGYGSQYGPNSAGISVKRLKSQLSQPSCCELLKEEILSYLQRGMIVEAYCLLWDADCSVVSDRRKKIFEKKFFKAEWLAPLQ